MKHMTDIEMIRALQAVHASLYFGEAHTSYKNLQELLVEAEEIVCSLKCDFHVSLPEPTPIASGTFDF